MDLFDYLHQGKVWISKTGKVDVEFMDGKYRARSARWLFRRAVPLQNLVAARLDADEELVQVIAILAQDPSGWLMGTPLFRTLLDGAELREHAPEVARAIARAA